MQVRDRRRGNWFWLHNSVFAQGLGPYEGWLYACLCRHAGDDESTWVSYRTLAEETKISDRKCREAMQTLTRLGLVVAEERVTPLGQTSNLYTLLDPPVPAVEGYARDAGGYARGAEAPGTVDTPPLQVAQTMKKTHGRRPMEEESIPSPLALNGRMHDPAHVWAVVLTDLAEQIVPANYERWLARTHLLGRDDGVAVIGVPDQIAADQITRRFDPLVRRALADALGEEVTVRYEVTGS